LDERHACRHNNRRRDEFDNVGIPADVSSSGYDFTAAPSPQADVGSPFHLGDFTHQNFPIYAPLLTSVDLEISIAGTIDGVAFAMTPSFTFGHLETLNRAPCAPAGATICPDVVSFLSSRDLSEVVSVGGADYMLIINGFEQGGDLVSSFVTEEYQANTASLFASIIEPAPIPLPAAGWLLVTGFLGLGAARRRRR